MQTQAKPEARSSRAEVWQLAWPAVVTNLLQSLVGLVDVKAVGTLGPAAVAAATAGHRVFFVLQTVLMAVVAGTTALVARAWGAGDRDEAARVVGSSLVLGCAVAAAMSALGIALAEPSATALGLSGEPARLAAVYIRWISAFNVLVAFGFVLGTGLRAAGDTRTPLLVGAVSNVANVLLLYALVYGGFGLTSLGIAGAALAGGLAFTAGAAVLGWLWLRRRLALTPLRAGALDRQRMRRLVAIGYPAALEQLVFQAGFIAFTFIIARHFGMNALAAYGIGVQILSFSFVVGFGFSIAASTLVGQHLGAGDPARAAQSGWRALLLAVGSMSVLSLLIVSAARPIAELMISDPEVVRLTVAFIYLLGAAQPLMAIEFALGGALRGAGDTRFPLMTTFAGLIGGRLVLAIVFTWLGLAVEWVYGALLADYVVKSILLIVRFRGGRWQHVLAPSPPPEAVSSTPPPEVAVDRAS
jgi:putative MATE family efflux protein